MEPANKHDVLPIFFLRSLFMSHVRRPAMLFFDFLAVCDEVRDYFEQVARHSIQEMFWLFERF